MGKLRGIALLAILCFASANAHAYVVQPGDTLSSVALKELKSPKHVYGDGGRLERLISYNPHLKNIDRIFPGDELSLEPDAADVPPQASEDEHGRGVASDVAASDSVASNSDPGALTLTATSTDKAAQPGIPLTANSSSTAAADDERDLTASVTVSQVYLRLDGTDRSTGGKATFISDLLTDVDVGLHQRLAPKHDAGVHVSWRQNKFDAPKTGQTASGAPSTKNIRAVYAYDVTTRFALKAAAGLEQRLFIRSDTATHYVFDMPQVPYFQAGFNWRLAQMKRSSFGIQANYTRLGKASAANQNIEAGSRLDAALNLQQQRGSFSLAESLFYSSGAQSSDIVEQKQTSVGVGFSLGYSF